MGDFQGADTEALRQVGTDFGGRAQQIDDLATRLAALVETVSWIGPDADTFRADFSGRVRPDLLECGTRIRRDAQEIEGHAEEQDASSDAGGEAGGPGAGGPGAGGEAGGPGAGGPGPDSGRAVVAAGVAGSGGAAGAVAQAASTGLDAVRDAGFAAGRSASEAVGGGLEFVADAAGSAVEFGADALQLVAESAQAPPMMLAQVASDAVGSGSPLEFEGSGLELEAPETSGSVAVGEDHDLHPGGVTKPFGFDDEGAVVELEGDTAYDVGDHGTFYTDADGDIAYVEATGGGDRMNPNLREVFPDATYHVNDNSFYRTDELGRTEHIYVPDVILNRDNARSQSIQSEVNGHYDMTFDGSTEELQFDAGHVLGRQFDGVREEINYTRQWSEVNQANGTDDSIYAYEDLMAKGIEDGNSYSFETRVTYDDDHQPSDVGPDSPPYHYIPESYDVHVVENGETIVRDNLANYPDGARFAD